MPERWDNAAALRQEQIETGLDLTFSEVFLPYYNKLISECNPSSVLEVGCGTGHLSREICNIVSKVVALEPSSGMYEIAKGVLCKTNVNVINQSIQDFHSNDTFDIILSHMCVQTIYDINIFFSSIRMFLSEGSHFIFSIPHPCFYNEYKKIFSCEEYSYMTSIKKEITFAITKDKNRSIAGVPYNHRPISAYFYHLKRNNMVAIDFHEIIPDQKVQLLYGEPWKTPRYCVFHVKRNH